jgi:hypothetical protein
MRAETAMLAPPRNASLACAPLRKLKKAKVKNERNQASNASVRGAGESKRS